ncbi:polysaccharide biosynthesis/export family protein [Hyphomicrobium sp. ghe19]|uniref:polysaccharide biosynthesis/export family protein n=1 Tax=Hyphomicrobium sp. ghe19 TaxID=2682968 RepID=UPI0030D115AF
MLVAHTERTVVPNMRITDKVMRTLFGVQKALSPVAARLPLLAAFVLSGCSHFPVNGPEYREIHRGATTEVSTPREVAAYDYALVDISPIVIDVLENIAPDSLYRTFGTQRGPAPVVRVGVGDVLQVSIFESSTGGLFTSGENASRAGNYVTLPSQAVGGNGNISVPYAGSVKAAGRTVPEVQRDIEAKLAKRAIEPQVIVNIVEQNADSVTVIGDAGGNKIKLIGSGERILDMISKANGGGGSAAPSGGRFAGYDLLVTLQRKGQIAKVPFTRLITNPAENIFVAAGDVIYVTREPKTYIGFGALASIGNGVVEGGNSSAVSAQYAFDQERLSLNEAIARAGGLADARANPAQVFLYRPERRETLSRMGVDLKKFAPDQRVIPTIYRANFRDPSSFFLGQRFQMRDKDLIYAANAESTEVTKFLLYVNTWTSTASGAMVSGRTVADIASGAHVLTNSTTTVVSP